ncbi:hypothetical protein WJX73_005111 [Symbiochloris irregularis]|uniref:Uncharacterized protein n=1 Tax=Symbiochloris irregularis TaxID=706552 RepID=A0AAW1NY76_9CHLO
MNFNLRPLDAANGRKHGRKERYAQTAEKLGLKGVYTPKRAPSQPELAKQIQELEEQVDQLKNTNRILEERVLHQDRQLLDWEQHEQRRAAWQREAQDHLSDTEAQLQASQHDCTELDTEHQSLKAAYVQLQEEHERAGEQVQESAETLASVRQDLEAAQARAERLTEELQAAQKRERAADANAHAAAADAAYHQKTCQSMREELNGLAAKHAGAIAQQRDESQAAVAAAAAEVQRLKKKLTEAKAVATEQHGLQAELASVQAEKGELAASLRAKEEQASAAQQEATQLQEDLAAQATKLRAEAAESAEQREGQAEEERTRLTALLDTAKHQVSALNTRLVEVQKAAGEESAHLQAQVTALQQSEAKLQDENVDLKANSKQSQDQLKNVQRKLSEMQLHITQLHSGSADARPKSADLEGDNESPKATLRSSESKSPEPSSSREDSETPPRSAQNAQQGSDPPGSSQPGLLARWFGRTPKKQEPSSPVPAGPEPSEPAQKPAQQPAKRKQPEAGAEEHSQSQPSSHDSQRPRAPKRSRLGDKDKAAVNHDLPEDRAQVDTEVGPAPPPESASRYQTASEQASQQAAKKPRGKQSASLRTGQTIVANAPSSKARRNDAELPGPSSPQELGGFTAPAEPSPPNKSAEDRDTASPSAQAETTKAVRGSG